MLRIGGQGTRGGGHSLAAARWVLLLLPAPLLLLLLHSRLALEVKTGPAAPFQRLCCLYLDDLESVPEIMGAGDGLPWDRHLGHPSICHVVDHRHGAGHRDVAAGVNVGHRIGLCTTLASLVGHETKSRMGVWMWILGLLPVPRWSALLGGSRLPRRLLPFLPTLAGAGLRLRRCNWRLAENDGYRN